MPSLHWGHEGSTTDNGGVNVSYAATWSTLQKMLNNSKISVLSSRGSGRVKFIGIAPFLCAFALTVLVVDTPSLANFVWGRNRKNKHSPKGKQEAKGFFEQNQQKRQKNSWMKWHVAAAPGSNNRCLENQYIHNKCAWLLRVLRVHGLWRHLL